MWFFLLRPDAGSPHIDNAAYLDVHVSYNMDNICRASNSVDVQIEDEEEPYEAARALDSDDDRPVQEMIEQEIELIRRLCPERDPAVHEFSSLSHSTLASCALFSSAAFNLLILCTLRAIIKGRFCFPTHVAYAIVNVRIDEPRSTTHLLSHYSLGLYCVHHLSFVVVTLPTAFPRLLQKNSKYRYNITSGAKKIPTSS
jgi:hypothetical protein